MPLFSKARAWFRKSLVLDRDHGGWIDTSAPWNFWQTGYTRSGGLNNVVHACVQAYAQTIAQLPGKHMRQTAQGVEAPVTNSALTRVMRKPNSYQTRSDFLLNLVCSLLYEGNAYAYAQRTNRNEISAIHLIPSGACNPSVIDGEAFYHISPEDISGLQPMIAPARDILHVRLWTSRDPLKGETPIYAAAQAITVNNALMGQQANFFNNMSRPSGVITTDEKLTPEQTQALRERWEDHAKGINSGKTPILTWGLKWQQMSIKSTDAQMMEALKFSVEDVARAFRVPLPIVGVVDGATYNNVHNLLSFWKASGLGFVIEHIEQAFAAFFGLPAGDRLELDVDRLMRMDMVARYDALTRGITGGLLAPNEARLKEGYEPVEGGDMPRVQQQMVPLDYQLGQPPAQFTNDEIDAALDRGEA